MSQNTIHSIPENERPREKMLAKGAAVLSDAELLAIFLRTGCAGHSAIGLARLLIVRFGSLHGVLHAPQAEFCAIKGLGSVKYAQLQAVLALATRYLQEQLTQQPVFTSPQLVKDFLQGYLRGKTREVFVVLYLDSQHRLICTEELFQGTIDSAAVYPREVVRQALNHHAAAVILAHNHPSGVTEPSNADINITAQIRQGLELMDIRLLDHFIVGRGKVLSLAERGEI